jgi:repressor LexA
LKVKHKLIIAAIVAHTERLGYPPSIREIGEAVGLKSTSTVHGYLSRLKDKGYIEWEPQSPRTLRIKSEVQG